MICLGKGTVSKAVKQLEADGYVRIERRRRDKRIRVLRPTHKAYYLSQQIQRLHHMIEDTLLEDYLYRTAEDLERCLQTMLENMPRLMEKEYLPEAPYSIDDIPDDPQKITPEQWKTMRTVDIRTMDKSQLVDIRTIKIDLNLPPLDRWYSYMRQVKNPYCFRAGSFGVKLNPPDEP